MKYKIVETKRQGTLYRCRYCDHETKSVYRAEKHVCNSLKTAQNLSEPKLAPTRIRYKKTSLDGVFESERTFVSNGARKSRYKAFININEGSYRIKNMDTRIFLNSGHVSKNTEMLKKKCKQRLEKLGVRFRTAIRTKRK